MTEKYWQDYTEFINAVETITNHSPSTLLAIYTDLLDTLEDKKEDKILGFKFELDNDINFRAKIQLVLDNKNISENELKREFEEKIIELDRQFKTYLTIKCITMEDWYKNIELNSDLFK